MNYLSRHCRSISPYTAGEQPRDKSYVKLNTNECPYPPSPAVEKTLREYETGDLRLYPDPDCTELRAVIAEKYGLKPQNVFVGNGSDEVLALCFPTFFDEGDEVAFADVTYTFYKVWAHAFGVKARVIPVDKELKLDPEDYLALPDSVRGVIICNPNAPTGMPMPRADIVRIAEQNSERVVIVDEAYCDFSQESMIGMLNELPNLVVVKTLSKAYALAGARCGFALASPYYAAVIDKISKEREVVSDALRALGFTVLPSRTNFVFASHKTVPASEIYFALKEEGVLVRHFKKTRIDNFVRITIGTREDTKALLDKVAKVVKNRS